MTLQGAPPRAYVGTSGFSYPTWNHDASRCEDAHIARREWTRLTRVGRTGRVAVGVKPFEIRTLHEDELPILAERLPRPAEKHRQRLEREVSGEGVYLVAWSGAEPAGHIFLFSPGLAAARPRRSWKISQWLWTDGARGSVRR
jgi:hypothetical protein